MEGKKFNLAEITFGRIKKTIESCLFSLFLDQNNFFQLRIQVSIVENENIRDIVGISCIFADEHKKSRTNLFWRVVKYSYSNLAGSDFNRF